MNCSSFAACLAALSLLVLPAGGRLYAQAPTVATEGPAPETPLTPVATPVAAPIAMPVTARPVSYALVVGSNAGGPGQQPLRYAETDAQRVSEVLTTLGGYDAEHVTRLLQPSGAELFTTLEQLETTLAAHAQAGEATRFFFYYSGHARSDALNIGDERVALDALRERLMELPATLSIVVLDACQSGAFARSKGAAPAADFSTNSVGQLSTEGVAVMASSTGRELSQESDELQSSHFTHHLVVALRGAGDVNADGAVTLSEAYDYAYGRTLSSTAVTRVGEQHVTLETALTGHGDVALTRPAEASARVIVPEPLVARVLIQLLPSHSVAAELDKVQGEAIALALPPGRYAATVRLTDYALRCPLILTEGASTTLSLTGCKRIELVSDVAKGGLAAGYSPRGSGSEGAPGTGPRSRWLVREGDPGDEGFFLELSVGATRHVRQNAYAERLDEFGYTRDESGGVLDGEIALGRRLHPHLALGLGIFDLDATGFENDRDKEQTFKLDSGGTWAFVQGDLFLGPGRFLDGFVRIGGGYAFADTLFKAQPIFPQGTEADDIVSMDLVDVEESYGGALFAAAIGVQLNFTAFTGAHIQARYTYAPIIDNELGETHDVGGLSVLTGIRIRTWESP